MTNPGMVLRDTDNFLDWLDAFGDMTAAAIPIEVASMKALGADLRTWRERALVAEESARVLALRHEHAEATRDGYRKQMNFFRDRKREVEEDLRNKEVEVRRLRGTIDQQTALLRSYEARLKELSRDPDREAIESLMIRSQALEEHDG